jgi:hypothetical protein
MKRFRYIVIIIALFVLGSVVNVHAQRKPQRTSSARAAYGTATPQFKSNAKRNKKAKKNAGKSGKRKKLKNDKEAYRRGMPI